MLRHKPIPLRDQQPAQAEPAKPKGHEEELAHALDFTAEDLEHNRAGQLSPRQTAHLRDRNRAWRRLLRKWLVVVAGAALYGYLIASSNLDYRNLSGLVFFMPGVTIAALFDLLSHYRLRRPLALDGARAEVARAEGRVRLNIAGKNWPRTFDLVLDDLTFPVTEQELLAFKNGDPYVLYYLPNTRTLLAAEWLPHTDSAFEPESQTAEESRSQPEHITIAADPPQFRDFNQH